MNDPEVKGKSDKKAMKVLGKLVRNINDKGIVVEVGCWLGYSTKVIGSNFSGLIFCVDTWKGTDNTTLSDYAKEIDIFSVFKQNMVTYGLSDRVHPLVMHSIDAMTTFADDSVDLVFIDADHSFNSVLEDIKGWYSKVKVDGIICGHDFDDGHPGVTRAVSDFFGEDYKVKHSVWYATKSKEG